MKRYDMQVGRIKHDCGESFVANMVEVAEGRYAEYEEANARIAELTAEVASLRGHCAALIGWLKTLDAKGFVDHHQDVEDARNALKDGV